MNLGVTSTINATQAEFPNKIVVSWATVDGANNYVVEYKKSTTSTWLTATANTNTYTLNTSEFDFFDFRVKARNVLGEGVASSIATGYIIPNIGAKFIEQSVPANVKAGEVFTASQTWKNVGQQTWTTTNSKLAQAINSDFFGSSKGVFASLITTGKTGTSVLTLQAPNIPGVYAFARSFEFDGVKYGLDSSKTDIRVWGQPTCPAVKFNKSSTFDINDTISVQLTLDDQSTEVVADVWSDVNGQDDLKQYVPTLKNGTHSFNIPLATHAGYGRYSVKLKVSNPVDQNNCFAYFDLHELAVPVLTIEGLIGKDDEGGYVVAPNISQPFLSIGVARSADLPIVVELFNSENALISSSPVPSGMNSASIPSVRWEGPAWASGSFSIKVRYTDPELAVQDKYVIQPLRLILSPSGNRVNAEALPSHPLVILASIDRIDGVKFDPVIHGSWMSQATTSSGQALNDFSEMVGGTHNHFLSYDQVYGSSLNIIARAIPPASVTLKEPLDITTSLKLPVLPVKDVAASDGSFEDFVRIKWGAPVENPIGFSFDIYRDDALIASRLTSLEYDDPTPTRGVVHVYRVVAIHNSLLSAAASDSGHIPTCRAVRLIGASLNADMTAVRGLVEKWECVKEMHATSGIDNQAPNPLSVEGERVYRSFYVPVPAELPDGSHVVHLNIDSSDVAIHSSRAYEIPFILDRASIAVKSLSITHNGSQAVPGLETNSIGRFGVRMEGASGIGFAEEVR